MKILIGSNKGGVGKTTTALNLAVGYALSGAKVCLFDADNQGSLANWFSYREKRNIDVSNIELRTKSEENCVLDSELEKLDSQFDFVIVDVAGRNSKEFISSLFVADFLITPTQYSQADLDTFFELKIQLDNSQEINPNLKSFCYQVMANPRFLEKGREDMKSYLSFIPQLHLLNSIGCNRNVYKQAFSEGKSVLEMKDEKAKKEIQSLILELKNHGIK